MSRLPIAAIALACLVALPARAQIVGSTLTADPDVNLIGFAFGAPFGLSTFESNPFSLQFSQDDDVFGVETRATLESRGVGQLLDDTVALLGDDTLGIIKAQDNAPFFGVVDTNNNDTDGPLFAEWTFDTTLFSAGLFLSIDFAAMGDFESSNDYYLVEAAFEGSQFQTIFESSVDDSLPEVDYTMEDGSVVSLADPLFINGVQVTNNFATFTEAIPGAGPSLSIRFTADADGAPDVFAFRNLVVSASDPSGGGQDGDFNDDGIVDAADYTVWRDNVGQTEGELLGGNGDGGQVGASDYALWAANYGVASSAPSAASAAPEPLAALLLTLAGLAPAVARRRVQGGPLQLR